MTIAFKEERADEYRIELLDPLGRKVYGEVIHSQKGVNQHTLRFDRQQPADGGYMLKFRSGDDERVFKVVKF